MCDIFIGIGVGTGGIHMQINNSKASNTFWTLRDEIRILRGVPKRLNYVRCAFRTRAANFTSTELGL